MPDRWFDRSGGRPRGHRWEGHETTGRYGGHGPGFTGLGSGFLEGWIDELEAIGASEAPGEIRIHARGERSTLAPRALEWSEVNG